MKILIIKTGYSETLDGGISATTSYGDVLRSTVLINIYKGQNITWLVDEKAFPIIKVNSCITRPMIYNLTSVLQLQSEYFDVVINLEKVPGLCALADSISAGRRFGYRFYDGDVISYDLSEYSIRLCYDKKLKQKHTKYWQELLYEMVGEKWNGEEYVFDYLKDKEVMVDIGLNNKVGSKWPAKGWDDNNWTALYNKLSHKYTVDFQQEGNCIEEYIRWIASCKTIITNDSFGLHLALAMKKKVIALFNCTNPYEAYMYNRGIALYKKNCKHQPCYNQICRMAEKTCDVSVASVLKAVEKIYG
jgi:heptosyltransferase-2